MIEGISKRSCVVALVVSWFLFAMCFVLFENKVNVVQVDINNQTTLSGAAKFDYGSMAYFSYSPDKKYIAFTDATFDESDNLNSYWAVKILDVKTRNVKTLLVTDSHLYTYDWIGTTTLRVTESLGTGVRGFRDISTEIVKPDVYNDYIKAGRATEFWQPDKAYSEKFRSDQLAREVYFGRW